MGLDTWQHAAALLSCGMQQPISHQRSSTSSINPAEKQSKKQQSHPTALASHLKQSRTLHPCRKAAARLKAAFWQISWLDQPLIHDVGNTIMMITHE
jgi:hypothetical protein